MERATLTLIGAIALIAVMCCLLAGGNRPGSAWGVLPGGDQAQAAQQQR